jgi:uncharacterized membrane protein
MAKRIGILVGILALAAAFVLPDVTLFAARKVGYAVCHQWPEHSFAAGGQVFPLCARCTGTYFGALAAMVFIWAAGRGKAGDWPPKAVLVSLAAGFALMAVDGVNSFIDVSTAGQTHLYVPSNALRFVTGGFNGLMLVSIGYPLLNYVLWKDWEPKPILRNSGELLALIAAVLVGLGAAQGDALLPAVALLNLAGILLLFTGINTALWLVLTRRERRAATFRDALPHLGVGLCMALGELLLFGIARSALESYLLKP